MENTITEEKIKRYLKITSKALQEAKSHIAKSRKNEAKEIINMAQNYLDDATYFYKKEDRINAFAALNYAHGWLDAGARLKIFQVKNDALFTLP
jgi:hypothetical protein